MEVGLQPAAWHEVFAAVAAAGAALLGLLFVAMSLHPAEVQRRATLRLRARVNLQALAAVLTVAIAVLLPGQSNAALGAEVLLITLIYLALVTHGAWQASREIGGLPSDTKVRLIVQNFLVLLQVAGGVSLIVGRGPGLYLLAPVLITVMPIVVFNCWNVIFAPELHGPEEFVEREVAPEAIQS